MENEKEVCIWTCDEPWESDCWNSSCGESFVLIEGTPKENNFKYCVYCGKELKEEIEGEQDGK